MIGLNVTAPRPSEWLSEDALMWHEARLYQGAFNEGKQDAIDEAQAKSR